jgi:hypothetical protein
MAMRHAGMFIKNRSRREKQEEAEQKQKECAEGQQSAPDLFPSDDAV